MMRKITYGFSPLRDAIMIMINQGGVGEWSSGERFTFDSCGPDFTNRGIEGINIINTINIHHLYIHMDSDSEQCCISRAL